MVNSVVRCKPKKIVGNPTVPYVKLTNTYTAETKSYVKRSNLDYCLQGAGNCSIFNLNSNKIVVTDMEIAKLLFTKKDVEYNLNCNVERQLGLKKLNDLLASELQKDEEGYRLLGSIKEISGQQHLTLIVEKKEGAKFLDRISGTFVISDSQLFELKGHVRNKGSVNFNLGLIAFLIIVLIYLVSKYPDRSENVLIIYPFIIGLIGYSIYRQPTKALRYLQTKVNTIQNQ